MAVILATASIVIALGPLVSRRPQFFILLGIALALGYWITGEGLGELLTFGGTDPNNGPMVALIGLAVLPMVPARESDQTPASRLVTIHPLAAVFSLIAIVLVPLAVAVVPTATSEAAPSQKTPTLAASSTPSAAATSMPGMSRPGSAPKKKGSASGDAAHTMNMTAMAGLGVTDAHWKYTGPALPAAEVSRLLTVGATTDAGHKMQTPNCTTRPTSQQILGATEYIQATSAAVANYKNLSTAIAAGYYPITNTSYPVVHYLNPAYMNTKDLMNPTTVDSLVYATTPYGPVLVAAMYLMPGPGNGPMPYGCLVQWHAHTNLCTNDRTGQIDGFTPCPPGTSHNGPTPMMTHVWQVPVAGGPLAMDPSDLQVVEAAIMAQQEGLAPTTTGALPPSSAST